MSRVNYYESAFNLQKEILNKLAELLDISKSGRGRYTIIDHCHYELLSELKKTPSQMDVASWILLKVLMQKQVILSQKKANCKGKTTLQIGSTTIVARFVLFNVLWGIYVIDKRVKQMLCNTYYTHIIKCKSIWVLKGSPYQERYMLYNKFSKYEINDQTSLIQGTFL